MAVSEKKVEESNRLRYIRLLERTANSIVVYVQKSEAMTQESLRKRIENKLTALEKSTKAPLYNAQYLALESFVLGLLQRVASQEDLQSVKQQIVHDFNQLQKQHNAKKYKKNKHAKSYLREWD